MPQLIPLTAKGHLRQIIVKQGLHELLERLEELVSEEAEVSDSEPFNTISELLRQAIRESLTIADYQWE